MKIAIASGKGGTGKTTLAVNLALYLAKQGLTPMLFDLDVEEPNCAGLLGIDFDQEKPIKLPLPVADRDTCNHCGMCADVCAFNAIAVTPESVMVFAELCHFCGRCVMRCPQHAMSTQPYRIGLMHRAAHDGLELVEGLLDAGQLQTSHLIGKIKEYEPDHGVILRDCPPGTTCPMVASVQGSDYVVMVTEPTPFGLHDLTLAVEAMGKLGLPFGVVINKSDGHDVIIERDATEKGYTILGRIPLSQTYAMWGADGRPLIDLPEFYGQLQPIAEAILAVCQKGCSA